MTAPLRSDWQFPETTMDALARTIARVHERLLSEKRPEAEDASAVPAPVVGRAPTP